MSATTCAFCHARAIMRPVWAGGIPDDGSNFGVAKPKSSVATRCDNCGMLNLALVEADYALTWNHQSAVQDAIAALDARYPAPAWYPKTVERYEYPNVPDSIARCATEAHQCSDIGATMAAILMTRAAVEATARNQKIDGRDLIAKINGLRDAGIIRQRLADAAHAIRYLGNDMAHADIEDPPSPDDVADTLKLMDALLTEVFDITATTDGILARRAERKQG